MSYCPFPQLPIGPQEQSNSIPAATFGAVADGVQVADGSMGSASANLACTTSTPFHSKDVGKSIRVVGAGAAGADLIATILTFTNSAHVVLSVAASTMVSSAVVSFGTDNSAAIQAGVNACAGTGIALRFHAGIYVFSTGVTLSSHLTMMGGPDVTLIAHLVTTGGTQSTANVLFLCVPNPGTTDTLSADAAQGAQVISTNVTHPVGQVIGVGSGVGAFQGSSYVVQAVSGSGPFSVTLDRPLSLAQPHATCVVTPFQRFSNIYILGGGMHVAGQCLRFFSMGSNYQSIIQDVVVDNASATDSPMSWDTYCLECYYIRLNVTGSKGVGFETCERCYAINCTFHGIAGTAQSGMVLLDCVSCGVIDCSFFGIANSMTAGVNFFGEDPAGCHYCTVRGGFFSGCGQAVNNSQGERHIIDGITSIGNLLAFVDGVSSGGGSVVKNLISNDSACSVAAQAANKPATVVDNCDSIGAGPLCNVSGAYLRICGRQRGPAVALSSGGLSNRGTVIANGTTAVNVAWADLQANDRVVLTLQTKGGTPGFPQVTLTPGTGFAITSFAGDTSTYAWEVQ